MKWNHEKILDIFNKENEDLITFGRNIFDIINLNKINYRETYFDDYLKRLKNNYMSIILNKVFFLFIKIIFKFIFVNNIILFFWSRNSRVININVALSLIPTSLNFIDVVIEYVISLYITFFLHHLN